MIEIDGSYGSGGGQILRTGCALAAITKKPCRIFNIRANRPKPGLAPQHLLGIQALARLSNAGIEGDFLGSEEIKFYPSQAQNSQDSLRIKIDTAGSITLILQTLILPSLFGSNPIKIVLDGGATDTFFSPTIDYFRYIFLKILEKTGARVKIEIQKRGYYPEGGAKVEAAIYPLTKTLETPDLSHSLIKKYSLKPVNLVERGKLQRILVISGASDSLKNKKVAERQVAGTREILGKLKLPIEEKIEYYDTRCPGSQICLLAEFKNTVIGSDNLGTLGKRAEDVGKEAALELLKDQKSGACLDKHLTDQILPYLALSGKKSSVTVSELTDHCKTNIWAIEKFIDGKFEINDELIVWNPSHS